MKKAKDEEGCLHEWRRERRDTCGLGSTPPSGGDLRSGLDAKLDDVAHGAHPGGELIGERLLEGMKDLAIRVEQGIKDLDGVSNVL
jgi:hypothetical protein